eukprot:4864045-Amphidinium_carterae.1
MNLICNNSCWHCNDVPLGSTIGGAFSCNRMQVPRSLLACKASSLTDPDSRAVGGMPLFKSPTNA